MKYYLFIMIALTLQACNNNKQAEQDLQKQVIAKHDSIMTNMDLLMLNKSKLNKISENLNLLKSKEPTLDTFDLKQNITNAKASLIATDDAMMNWMNNFNPDYTGKSHQEILDYLNNQKVKIDAVEKAFNQSISNSNSIILKYNHEEF